MSAQQQEIAQLVKTLRIKQGLTQTQLADRIGTSQSAIARIERGKHSSTTNELLKLSAAFGHPIITIAKTETDDIKIEGGQKLSGQIVTNTSKNGALGLMCAALLNQGVTKLKGIPRIEEIFRMIEVMQSIGIDIKWSGDNTLIIQTPKKLAMDKLNASAAVRMRSTIMLIGALAHRVKKFHLPHSGGCKMGKRTIAAHKHGLESFGISIKTDEYDHVISQPKKFIAPEITMYEQSDTATENILIAAALVPGKTVIHFGQRNYMVQDVIGLLKRFGVKIYFSGSSDIVVEGVSKINKNVTHWNSEDPIESMAFITAGIVTRSKLTVKRCPIEFLRLELLKLERMNAKLEISKIYKSHNRTTELVDISISPSKLKALPEKIHAQPFPGINTDNLPFFIPIATQASGVTLIHDWMWENRAVYFTELNRMNASIRLADQHRVFVDGPTKLRAAQIICPPALRPSMIIMIAMLAAPGESVLRNVYSIRRGYENIVERLNAIGAKITPLAYGN